MADAERPFIVGKPEFTIDDLLRFYPPPIRNALDRLRRMVLEVAPDTIEKANGKWRGISFRDRQIGSS